ncbi:MAG TPA: carbohydrate ABC transporter permease [Fimbriimonas sp.]|nr:carbohydrate ABC transporter permease [Fimbriimonas sp.]
MQVQKPTTEESKAAPLEPVSARLSDMHSADHYARITRRSELNGKFMRVVLWITLCVGAAIFMMPLYIMTVMSLKTNGEVAATAPWEWPKELTWENFQLVLTNPNAPFMLFFRNTFVISAIATFGVLMSAALVAYAFARLKFRGRDRLFLLLLSTMMLPGMVTMIPSYVMFAKMGWVDSMLPLTVPAFFGGGAFNIFLLRQFFMGIPRELDEAAILDGAPHSVIFWKIIMPNSMPALTTVGVFAFIYNWKDFQGPLIYLNDPEKQTLEAGLRTYQTLHNEQWNLLMAGAMLVMIPLIIMFIAGQRYFVKGITMSGLK